MEFYKFLGPWIFFCVCLSPTLLAGDGGPSRFDSDIVPILQKNCTVCHGGAKKKAGLALDAFKGDVAVVKDLRIWEKVLKRLRAREMPPEERPRLSGAEFQTLTQWIEAGLAQFDCNANKDPGRVTLRRLNRIEFKNTIRDLLGLECQLADEFPADDIGYGFDNIGDVMSLPPILMEKYLAAAEKLAAEALKKGSASAQRILACQSGEADKKACAREILGRLAERAFRRPVTEEEVGELARLAELAASEGESFEKGIELALEAVLVSPRFLFRIEVDPDPADPDLVHPINEWELATRLSYFLWSSMPDEELFAQARAETLRRNLEAQVARMLKDPKSGALVENFSGQWLGTRALKTFTPDRTLFPEFDEELRAAMRQETELFFEAVLREDRSLLDFIDADFTFANDRLARLYGIPGVQGSEFRRVPLPPEAQRGGVLTQASVLAVTSNPTRTSPVKRGKWVLEQILGAPPPPPPGEVPELSEKAEAVQSGSLRQRMEAHRANPSCAVCHLEMDAIGFGFENFNAVGAWRTRDGKFPIDPAGTLPGGRSFKGPAELKAILKGNSEAFSRCLAEKMLTYALGRGLEYYDKCHIDQIVAALARNSHRFSSLILGIVKTDAFQMRRGERGSK
ncbi:MAG: DUF1592 domain-containing protein [Planctomycetes bacterium]|nr:DUF1592 domain-containing protein [Planctomycetota bacterium]